MIDNRLKRTGNSFRSYRCLTPKTTTPNNKEVRRTLAQQSSRIAALHRQFALC
jgi:hypothetical protein